MTRYQSDPGQATAYMIGQLQIKKSRKYSNDELKDDFSLRDFHYQVNFLSLELCFSNHEVKTKEIITVSELWIPALISIYFYDFISPFTP